MKVKIVWKEILSNNEVVEILGYINENCVCKIHSTIQKYGEHFPVLKYDGSFYLEILRNDIGIIDDTFILPTWQECKSKMESIQRMRCLV